MCHKNMVNANSCISVNCGSVYKTVTYIFTVELSGKFCVVVNNIDFESN